MAQRRASWRRIGLIAAVAISLPVGLTSCAGEGSAGARVITVERPDGSPHDSEVYDHVFDNCASSLNLTITQQIVPYDGYIAKVLQQASSKTMPDVLMLDNGDLAQIADSGALAPLGDFGVTTDGYAPGVIDASSYDGELYGIQPVANTIALFYNKDLLDAAGVTPPTTWDELKFAAAALTQGDTYGIAFSAAATEEGTFQFLPFMWSNGGDEADIATQKTADALQLWTDLVSSGSASKSVLNWSQSDANDQFIAGKAAMMVNGPWQFPLLDEAGIEYEVAPIPAPAAGEAVVSPLGGETWTVPQTGDESLMNDAAKVVECIGSDDNQEYLATERDTVPTKVAVAEQFAIDEPKMQGFADQVPGLRSRTAELGAEYPAASQKIYTAIQTALTGGAAPLEALQQADRG